jgi:integrase
MRARPRPAVTLTDLKVKSLKPDPAGEYVQGDLQVPGLGVRVRPHGTKTYVVMKHLPGGKQTRITLGKVPLLYPPSEGEIGLAAARELAREAIVAVRRGIDPAAQKRGARERARAVLLAIGFAEDSFGAIAENYIALETKRLARGAEVESIIRRRLLPPWGERPAAELRRRDLTKLVDEVAATGRIQAAHKVREIANRVVNWAVDRGDLEFNLLASTSRAKGGLKRSKRDRVLSPGEIRAIWAASKIVGPPLFGELVRALLITQQRRRDVAGMERRELDLEQGLWTIPPRSPLTGAKRYKTDIDHAVPLSPAAVELLKGLPVVDPVYVFSTEPGTSFSGFSKAMRELRKLAGVEDWRLHDLRRTARTETSPLKNAAGQRVGADIAERVLGHVNGGVRGIYDRYDYLDEKREALELWAARLREIVDPPPGNVVPLRPGAAA